MDFLDLIFGRDKRNRDDITDTIKSFSRWIVSCGCLVIAAVVAGFALVLGGVIDFGTSQLNVVIVFVMIIVATASLIRSSIGR